MGFLEDLHQEHKARKERIQKAAHRPQPPPIPKPAPKIELPKKSSFEIVLQETCAYYKVRKVDVLSTRRHFGIATKRQVMVYMCYLMTRLNNPQIAQRMNRDPTTIWYAITKIHNNLSKYQEDIDNLEKLIQDAFIRENIPCEAQKRL